MDLNNKLNLNVQCSFLFSKYDKSFAFLQLHFINSLPSTSDNFGLFDPRRFGNLLHNLQLRLRRPAAGLTTVEKKNSFRNECSGEPLQEICMGFVCMMARNSNSYHRSCGLRSSSYIDFRNYACCCYRQVVNNGCCN